MKRWQTRGEVQDSDEEELGLEDLSQSPEYPRKKVKIDGDDFATGQDADPAETGIHGLDGSPAAKEVDTASDIGGHVEEQQDLNGHNSVHLPDQEKDDEPAWTTPAIGNTYGRLQRKARSTKSDARDLIPVITENEQNAVNMEDVQATYEIPSSGSIPQNPVASPENVAPQIDIDDYTTPKANNTQADDILSRFSSPLSELSDPPESPPAFWDLPGSAHVQTHARDSPLAAISNDDIVEIDGHGVPALLLTQGARRSLRARQEKQLHPYMYDRAQYQQQCRDRGLRPVRLMEQSANETQDATADQDHTQPTSSAARPSSSSSSFSGFPSSGAQLEESLDTNAGHLQTSFQEDDLPDLDTLLQNREYKALARKRMRRLKSRKSTPKEIRTTQSKHLGTTEDIFAIPPSPPLSSRDSAPTTAKAPRGFRLPRGLSPMPPPTPQISSELRPARLVDRESQSDEDTPPRTSRRLTGVRSGIVVSSDSSSGSESESESTSENDQMALVRERRRIRGVLPASWLNIDRKAHPTQKPTSAENHDSRPSATQQAPQKGVARTVQKRSTVSLGSNLLEISDDGNSSGSNNATPTANQRTLPPQTEIPGFVDVQDDLADSDDMEVDWVDPMLAGGSHRRSSSKPRGKKKSRTDNTHERSMPDFSEERNGLRQMQRSKPSKQGRTTKARKPASKPSKRPPRLSILDAQNSPTPPGSTTPQFVRLASRQARREPRQGRHSPSGKLIHLATQQDTAQANSTLEEWRQGRITQRRLTHAHAGRKGPEGVGNPGQASPQTPVMNGTQRPRNLASSSVQQRLGLSASNREFGATQTISTLRRDAENGEPPAHRARPGEQHQQDTSTKQRSRRPLNARPPQVGARYRGAQLETPESAYLQETRTSAFQRRMQLLTETVTRRTATPAPGGLPMARFLPEPDGAFRTINARPPEHIQPRHDAAPQPAENNSNSVRLPHRPRKRRPQRIDVEARQYRQPSEPLPVAPMEQENDNAAVADPDEVLKGLGPPGKRYATHFDIRHLPAGTYFHQSTFIGSGDLAAAIAPDGRNMDEASGSIRIYVNSVMHEWTAWSEEVSTAMAEIPAAITTALQTSYDMAFSSWDEHVTAVSSNVDHMLRSTIRYLSSCLYFLDAIDRRACCQRIDQVIHDILETIDDTEQWTTGFQNLRRKMVQYALVLARQNQIIGNGLAPSESLRTSITDRIRRCASRLASCLVPGELDMLRSAYEEQRFASTREHGIRQDDSTIAGVTILYHCLRDHRNPRSLFWEVISKALGLGVPGSHNAADIDQKWYNIFTLLPCLDFDSTGMIQQNPNILPEADWSLPRQLVERCLELYPSTSTLRGTSINEYVRATLTRCSRLFNTWRWWRCEPLLSVVYDFFARRNMSLLHREEGKGSPEFLDNLTAVEDAHLEVGPDDRSFCIFLKMLAAALRTWREHNVYPDKKIGSIAWRIIPNHARIYRKDAEVKQTDLDALRNHFDLLCTLYFASPLTHRLRVDMLRNLVDHSSSHREACRISVRAWSRIASFQMSTDESADALEPFVGWFKDMTQTTIAQYRFARTEAEQQYNEAKAQGAIGLTDELLERTVSSNQRQIAATVVDLLAAFRRALTSASSLDSARFFLESCEPWKAFDSFDPSERRLMSVFNEALDLIKAAVDVQNKFSTTSHNHDSSEDSQDYGDFSLLQEFATGQTTSQNNSNVDLVELIQEACAQLLSNAFGSEVSPDDALLARSVDIWIQLATYMVSRGLRSWSNFVNDYNAGAWFQLRDTAQHRKFTPYVLAKILENDPEAFDSLKETFLAAWLKSLLERESTLKYQHLFTVALLNTRSDEPLLSNLPFSRATTATSYQITLQELRQGRLNLISTVLANMLQNYDRTLLNNPHALPELRRNYTNLLRQLMQTMKSNYQDLQLGNPADTADSSVQSAYVAFVQQVVTFLQQYTNDHICAIDKFFLDSSAFPLPATDPTYVVGRLRSNGPKLSETKTRKKVATFLHAVSERAAIDGQQAYLADQFYRAMAGTTELGDAQAPSLRHVILTSIFPLYIENALDESCTWIFALPMLEASAKTVADLLYDTILDDENSLTATVEVMSALLGAVQVSIAQAITSEEKLKPPHVLKTAAAMFELCRASVVFAHHIQRTKRPTRVTAQLRSLQTQASKLEDLLTQNPEQDDFFFDPPAHDLMDLDDGFAPSPPQPTTRWSETQAFSARQLQQSMANDWHYVHANEGLRARRVFVRKGNSSREVVVHLGTYEAEKGELLKVIKAFGRVCDVQHRRGGRRRRYAGKGDLGLGGLVI